jgi:DNA-3-methyladenine glycosylase II
MTPDDYRKAERLIARRDPVLRAVIGEIGACGMAARQQTDHLTALVRSLVGQQLSTKAAATIFARVCALVPDGAVTARSLAAVEDRALRSAGLSGQKLAYIRDLCARVEDERLKLEELDTLADEDVIDRLTTVKGFGRWTAEMFLMFRLHRPDVLPVGDLGIRNAIQRLYRLRKPPNPKRMLEIGEAWRPYRSVACWYLWRTLSFQKDDAGRPTLSATGAGTLPRSRRASRAR